MKKQRRSLHSPFTTDELSAILSEHAAKRLQVGHAYHDNGNACAIGVAWMLTGEEFKPAFGVSDRFDSKYRRTLTPEEVLNIWSE